MSSETSKSKKVNTRRFEGLDLPLGRRPVDQLSFIYDTVCTEREALEAAHAALLSWNQKSKSNKGRTYELLEIAGCKRMVIPYIVHCNFIARPYRGSEWEHKLFFAEMMHVSDNNDEDGEFRCTKCCILGPTGTKSGLVGCKVCCVGPNPVQHPENGDFMKGHAERMAMINAKDEKRAISERGSRLQKEANKCARIALSSWNVEKKSEKYELVEALGCRRIAGPSIFHCNFLARPENGNGDEAENILFFAELKYSKEFGKDGKVTVHGCHLCCILGPSGAETGTMECEFCVWDSIRIHHPVNQDFIKEWKRPVSKFMPKKQSETR